VLPLHIVVLLAQVLRARFAAEGVAGERLVLVPAMARRALVESYAEIDIALDTFPWSGGATSFEALWMGAPLVTLAADRPIGRVSASILAAMGHRDLIADTPHQYVETAIGLARDLGHLEALQARMRPALEASACFDMARYAAAFLAAIATAWPRMCQRSRQSFRLRARIGFTSSVPGPGGPSRSR
jgi:predicted O-linked N-acetylglucosamine transferase (SPINDLY family)